MMKSDYYISFVVTTRNDEHGENMPQKNQFFLDMWAKQVKKYNLNAELVIVEWNPESNKSLLKDKLNFPKLNKNQIIRIITVSNEEHKQFKNSDKLNIFQMIAKNVGIKRSNGKFILVTNIDIIFSDKIFEFLSKKKLKDNTIYRCDRYDINYSKFNVLSFSEDEALENCTLINKKYFSLNTESNEKNFVQISIYSILHFTFKNFKSMFSINNYSYKNSLFFKYLERFGFRELTFKRQSRILVFLIILPFFRMIKYYLTVHIKTMTKYYLSIFITVFFKKKIHTNACGDFTLTCRKTWLDLNGYYEFQGYSWHLDSIFLFKALNNKKKFIDLKYKIYHINQTDKASGYIAGEDYLFKKLIKNKINFIDDKKLKEILNTFKKNPKFLDNNKWGLKNKIFNEYKYF